MVGGKIGFGIVLKSLACRAKVVCQTVDPIKASSISYEFRRGFLTLESASAFGYQYLLSLKFSKHKDDKALGTNRNEARPSK